LYLTEEHLSIYELPEVKEYLMILERCVEQQDILGFKETMIQYSQLIQELTLSFNQY
jgi:hypothetical protein